MVQNTFRSILLIYIFIQLSNSSKVPVYIWGKQSLENFPTVSALESINGKTFKDKFLSPLLQQKQTLIVYIQDTLSLEDLSSQDENGKKAFQNLKKNVEKHSSVLLPSVDNPSAKLAELDSMYKVKQIYLNESFMDDILPTAERNNIVLLYLPDSKNQINRNKILNKNDNMIKKVEDILSKVKKPFTYFYTGYDPSWNTITDEARIARHLLAVDEPDASLPPYVLNFTECGLLYTSNVTLNLAKNQSISEGDVSISIGKECSNDNSSVIQFDINIQHFSEEILSASLTLDFLITSSGWALNKSELTLSTKEEPSNESYMLETVEMNAPKGFSYSCWQTIFKISSNSTITGNMTFYTLQLQPFTTGLPIERFASSFDCVPYFTIPIWMGFLVVMLFTGILAFGIYMLFNIRTMDRFDDPKGKTISVPTGE